MAAVSGNAGSVAGAGAGGAAGTGGVGGLAGAGAGGVTAGASGVSGVAGAGGSAGAGGLAGAGGVAGAGGSAAGAAGAAGAGIGGLAGVGGAAGAKDVGGMSGAVDATGTAGQGGIPIDGAAGMCGVRPTLDGGAGGTTPKPSSCSGPLTWVGDFDGDGIDDCARGVVGTSAENVVFNKGSAFDVFSSTGVVTTNVIPALVQTVAVFDLNHDRRDDIVLSVPALDWSGKSQIILLRGQANGTFVRFEPGLPNGSTTIVGDLVGARPVVGDFNGDGTLDLLTAALGATDWPYIRWSVLTATDPTDPAVIQSVVGLGARPFVSVARPVDRGDFNHDGKLDAVAIVVASQLDPLMDSAAAWDRDAVAIALGAGDGKFSTSYVAQTRGATSAEVLDVDCDGNLDLVVTFPAGTATYLGDGKGAFTRSGGTGGVDGGSGDAGSATVTCNITVLPPGPTLWSSIGDFDGDGVADCASAVAGNDSSHVDVWFYPGMGDTIFASAPVVTAGIAVPASSVAIRASSSVNTVDFNGDGRHDIILFSFNKTAPAHGTFAFLRGNADGTFSGPISPDTNGRVSNQYGPLFTASDFDGDGLLDGLMASALGGRECAVILSATPTAVDLTATETCFPSLSVTGIGAQTDVVDVNGDGNPDALLTIENPGPAPGGSRLAVALGDGHRHLALVPSSIPYGILGTEGIISDYPLDANGDQKLDLVIHNLNTATRLFFGDGAGNFSPTAP